MYIGAAVHEDGDSRHDVEQIMMLHCLKLATTAKAEECNIHRKKAHDVKSARQGWPQQSGQIVNVLAATAHVVMQYETADLVVRRSLRHLSRAKMGAAPTPALVCP